MTDAQWAAQALETARKEREAAARLYPCRYCGIVGDVGHAPNCPRNGSGS